MTTDEQRAEALDRAWAEALHGREIHESGLDQGVLDTIRRVRSLRPPDPTPAFIERLHGQFAAERARRSRFRPSPLWVALVAATAALAVAVALLLPRPHKVSAAIILQRARAAAVAPARSGIRSLVLTETELIWPRHSGLSAFASVRGPIRITIHRWYQAPDHWRVQRHYARLPDPLLQDYYGATSTQISNGRWDITYNAAGQIISRLSVAGQSPLYDIAPYGQRRASLAALRAKTRGCYRPGLLGMGKVAGRTVYKVDLGSSRCPSNSMPDMNGRQILWIDTKTSLILRSRLYASGHASTLYIEDTVTSIHINVPIPARTFSLPAARPVPQPTPVALPSHASVSQIRRVLPFPIFVPTWLPANLHHASIQTDASRAPEITINYQLAGTSALSVLDGPAHCCLDADPRKYVEPIRLRPGVKAYRISNEPQFGGPILWWDQRGTYIALSGPHLTFPQLVRMARSMSSSSVP